MSLVFIGTYTRPPSKSKGIYTYRFDPKSGALSHAAEAAGIVNPSFLAFHPNGRFLYSVAEVADPKWETGGAVTAYSINRQTGVLTQLNTQSTKSAGPCHLVVDRSGKCVVVANYHGGAVTVLPLKGDGSLGEASDFVQHTGGTKVDPKRQEKAHAHSATLSPDGKFVVICDLGRDEVITYALDAAAGKVKHTSAAKTAPGAGPRHFDFHPNGKFAHAINELGNTVTTFSYDAAKGSLKEIHTAPTLPTGWAGSNTTADVHVHPSGKWLYGSNRGHHSIAMFAIDEKTGRLTALGQEPTQGKTPRNFAIDPTGSWLLAENQDSDSIVTFRIDPKTGKLSATGQVANVPMPVCLRFLP
jgi:6-phosphogluconolactonase